MDPFRERSGILDLKTGKILDDETGEEVCLGKWTRDIDAEQRAALRELQADRDITSAVTNLPGDKPYFDNEKGLGGNDIHLRTEAECRSDLGGGLKGGR